MVAAQAAADGDASGNVTVEQCGNCNQECSKPLRCSVCKAKSYCSQKCQKEDWCFHKRNCKKAEPPKKPEPELTDLEKTLEAKKMQESIEAEMGTDDPKIAEQVKQMMSGMMKSGDEEAKPKEEEKPPPVTCANCMNACDKPLRCGVCKSATYCSGKCQKEDWQFHKRNCKKPVAKVPKVDGEEPPTDGTVQPKEQAAPPRPKPGGEKEMLAGEDVGDWYKHREWKPTEDKKEFEPKRVETPSEGGAKGSTDSASVWNKAGTWEEKAMVPWWKDKLAAVKDIKAESFAGMITVDGMSEVTGDAQIVHVRGTPRFLFDLRFDLGFTIKFPKSSRAYQGQIKLTEFSNDVAREGQLQEPYRDFPVEVIANSDADKRAVNKSFMPLLQALLHESVKQYQAQAVSKGGGAYPGQLPPSTASPPERVPIATEIAPQAPVSTV